MCTCLGGAGFVGYKVLDNQAAQVQRDMCVEQGLASTIRALGHNHAICAAVTDKEKERVARGVHPATLEDGETLLVEWWTVLKLWNDAMGPFDELAKWGHEHYVYGETSGWHMVTGFLERTEAAGLHYGQYAKAAHTKGGAKASDDLSMLALKQVVDAYA